MGKISWELTAIAVARYAHEIRVPVSRAIDKLLDDAGLDPATETETNKYAQWIVSHATDGTEEVPSDTRYLSVMKRMITQCLINLKKINKTGDETLDTSIVEFYNSDTGRELLHGLYSALKKLDNPNVTELFGTVTDADMPCIVVCNDAPSEYNTFNTVIGQGLHSGVTVRGTALGLGKYTVGNNMLEQREYHSYDDFSNCSTDPSKLRPLELYFRNVGSIPPGTPGLAAYQQFYRATTTYIGDERMDYTADDRPCDYEHCQFFATVPAGEYKLICECYIDSGYPWVLRTHDNENPYIALIDSNDTILIKKSMNQAYAPVVQDPLFDAYDNYSSPNNHAFYHEEYAFTVSATTDLGFISKIYSEFNGNVLTRFQIAPSSVVAQPFYIDETYNGVTCWEPYGTGGKYELTLTATNLLDGSSYSETKELENALDDEHTTVFFYTNDTVMASLNAGLVELDILEKDSQGNSGKISTKYLR